MMKRKVEKIFYKNCARESNSKEYHTVYNHNTVI